MKKNQRSALRKNVLIRGRILSLVVNESPLALTLSMINLQITFNTSIIKT